MAYEPGSNIWPSATNLFVCFLCSVKIVFIYLIPLDLITVVCENEDCNQWIPTHDDGNDDDDDDDDDDNNIILVY